MRNKEIIAGKGKTRKIDQINSLIREFGGKENDWVKMKGIGTVDINGKNEIEEIHWYEEPTVGKVRLKIKKR